MSIRLMCLTRECEALASDPMGKFVLLTLADFANDDGDHVYPSVQTVSRLTSLSERTVRYKLADLKALGLITQVASRPGTVVHYRINVDALTKSQPRQEVQGLQEVTPAPDAGEGVQEMQGRGARDAPNPLINHQLEPENSPIVPSGDMSREVYWKAFLSEYPKREGALDAKKARAKFYEIPMRDMPKVIQGTRAYCSELRANGKYGTEFVRRMTTFLNNETWREYAEKEPSSGSQLVDRFSENLAQLRRLRGGDVIQTEATRI